MAQRLQRILYILPLSLLLGCVSSPSIHGVSRLASMQVQAVEVSDDVSVSVLPDDPALQSILTAGIAQNVTRSLAYKRALTVRSVQTVSFGRESLTGQSAEESDRSIRDPRTALASLPHTTIQVDLESVMTQTSMRATFKRPSSDQAEMILELTTKDGQPMFQETHWYADRQGYLPGTPYEIAIRSGVEELKIDHAMWNEIQVQGAPVCALAEFFYTWLGQESLFVSGQREIISQSTMVSIEHRDGEALFHLIRPCYDDKEEASLNIRVDHFFFTMDFKLVAWNSLYTSARFGKRLSYMVVDRSYSYPEKTEQ